ncbi:hypothetical protein [Clostridium sp.]
MFKGLFSKKTAKANMGWRYVRYNEKEKAILLIIEPLVGRPDIVYVPDESTWINSSPKWAKQHYSEIIGYLKSLHWNRELEWRVTSSSTVMEKNVSDDFAVPGSLESTPGGREFEKENLFKPESPLKSDEVHNLWCTLETRFAEQASGIVRIFANDIIPDSVFSVISLPILKQNPNVTLEFISED